MSALCAVLVVQFFRIDRVAGFSDLFFYPAVGCCE
jgi:hypothetical protein